MDDEPKCPCKSATTDWRWSAFSRLGPGRHVDNRADYKIQIKGQVSLVRQSAGSRRSDHALLRALPLTSVKSNVLTEHAAEADTPE